MGAMERRSELKADEPKRAVPYVLVVEDDPTVADVVSRYLEREGYRVEAATDGRLGLERATDTADPPDLVLLDLMLPGMDGLEVFRRVRQRTPVPIIMLTARGDEDDRVAGLELGADDYIAKPFSPRELTARVKAVLRRASGELRSTWDASAEALRAGDLEVDLGSRDARVGGRLATLTALEFELLAFFMSNPHRVFRREELLERVWGYTFGDTSTVTVHVRRIREKIESDPANPTHVQTVWGVGYRFEP
jgi:DNA-binding response OmpR family regulator